MLCMASTEVLVIGEHMEVCLPPPPSLLLPLAGALFGRGDGEREREREREKVVEFVACWSPVS